MNRYEIVMHVYRTIEAESEEDLHEKLSADIDTIETVVDPHVEVEYDIADVYRQEDDVDENAIDCAIEDRVFGEGAA